MPPTAPTLLTAALAWVAAATPLPADDPPAPPTPPAAEQPTGDPPVELVAYRTALENAKRQIETLQRQLDEARHRLAFLEDTLTAAGIDPDRDDAGEAPSALDARREALLREQEEARARVRAIRQQRVAEREAERAAEAERKANAPKWNITWQVGFLHGPNRQVTYVEQTEKGQVVFIGEKTTVDRRNVVMRGTFENRSIRPYRYTFDVGVIEDDQGRGFYAIGHQFTSKTRYQTPVLEPGELHRWEVRLAVEDSLQIDRTDVANVRAEAFEYVTEPKPAPAAQPPPATPTSTPPPTEAVNGR